MADAIISRQTIRNRGAAAYHAGKPRDSHNFNPGSPAIFDFLIGYDLAKSQHDTAVAERVELAQEA